MNLEELCMRVNTCTSSMKKETESSLSKKDENFDQWYSEVVVNSEMIEYYDIAGLYILRPWAMSVWEIMQEIFNSEMKKMKVKNCYFPLLSTFDKGKKKKKTEKIKNHFEGFNPEVAWVTRSGDGEDQTVLDSPIAIRPTSETIMYESFSKWIRSHCDLPLKLNQWCNVVRWESGHPIPFIRSREFLWQEGHSAFATKEKADAEVLEILELYRRIYEEYLAVPIIKGEKSESEKFPGGVYTTTVEAFIPDTGRGVEGATSHSLGQNFATAFDISFEDESAPQNKISKAQKGKDRSKVWQNSWSLSTRTIGAMIMVHGDDKGLVLPPRVAPLQVIVVPVSYTQEILNACNVVVDDLCKCSIRAKADRREDYSNWEMKGVPIRIEISANKVRAIRRDNGARTEVSRGELVVEVEKLLEDVQKNLFESAKRKRDDSIRVVKTWEEFMEALGQKKMILAPWCDEQEVEEDVKARTGGEMGSAKILCFPFEPTEVPEGTKCFASGRAAKKWSYWGRSY